MLQAMKKAEVTLQSSNSKLSLTASALRQRQPMLPMSGSLKFHCQRDRSTESLWLPPVPLSAFKTNPAIHMKLLIPIAVLAILSPLLRAQEVVTDPVSDTLSEEMHLEDIAKYVQMVENQVQQITTLTQQLQQVQAYVKAFGDPSQIVNVTGANQLIGSLQQNGVGQTMSKLQQLATGANALTYTGNGIYQSQGTSFTTPDGVQIPRAQDLYTKYGAVQGSSQNFQSVTNDVLARRETLRQQIAATTQELQSSTTDAETQKLNGVLAGYTAELQTVDREIDHAAEQVATQDAENRADREIDEQARREERQAQVQEGFSHYSNTFQIDTAAPAFPSGH